MACYATRIEVWIGHKPELHTRIISAMHTSPLGGHSGVPVTVRKLKQYFAWSGMNKAVHHFVTSCSICKQAKPDRARYPGLLQPLPIPDGAWHTVSMDFIEGLPRSSGMNVILVVVDKFSKYSHFLALCHPFNATTVAKLFMSTVYKLHGMPTVIISDRDKIFTSQLWQELFNRAGVTLKMSSAYHPQTDGQTEWVNQCLETFLRCFVHAPNSGTTLVGTQPWALLLFKYCTDMLPECLVLQQQMPFLSKTCLSGSLTKT
jgi:transposase InsO family protein